MGPIACLSNNLGAILMRRVSGLNMDRLHLDLVGGFLIIQRSLPRIPICVLRIEATGSDDEDDIMINAEASVLWKPVPLQDRRLQSNLRLKPPMSLY